LQKKKNCWARSIDKFHLSTSMYRYATYRYTTFRFHFRFHVFHCHVTYITICDAHACHVSNCRVTYITIRDGHATYPMAMSPTAQHMMAPARHVSNGHVTHSTTHDGTGTPRIYFPSLITPSTQYLRPFVTIQVLSRDLPDHTP
jgi:hypothetical protein